MAKIKPDADLREALGGISRQTLWRLRSGQAPSKEQAEVLIQEFKQWPIVLDGESFELDYNGCYEQSLELKVSRIC